MEKEAQRLGGGKLCVKEDLEFKADPVTKKTVEIVPIQASTREAEGGREETAVSSGPACTSQ